MRRLWDIFRELYKRFFTNNISALAAQVTFYLILSFFPFLIFLVTLMGYTQYYTDESSLLFLTLLPATTAELIERVISDTTGTRSTSMLSFGMLGYLWSASNGITALMYGMNRAYNVKETRSIIKVRLISILFTIGLSLGILLTLFLVVFGEILSKKVFDILNLPYSYQSTWDFIRYGISIVAIITIFIMLYFVAPNYRVCLRETIPGSVLTSLVWIILSLGFSYYVNHFADFSVTYGRIGSIICLLIWLYWSSIILLLGNELNAILKNKIC